MRTMTDLEMARSNAEMVFDQTHGAPTHAEIATYAGNVLDTLRDWGCHSTVSGQAALAAYYARVAELLTVLR